jgi:hypothetical protein
MLIIRIRRNSYWWNAFVIVFSIFWIYWCYYFWSNYDYYSVFFRILNYMGIALFSPDIQSIFRVFFGKK